MYVQLRICTFRPKGLYPLSLKICSKKYSKITVRAVQPCEDKIKILKTKIIAINNTTKCEYNFK